MGINGLWDVLGDGEVWHIADHAAKHFKDTGRPLRIAVDEATWRFTNLTPEQVEEIREGEPAANPVEKTILWKPGKSRRAGRGGGKVDQECIRLLHRMFRLLKVPFHQAPGEAEAECARLQRLGVVDAVWSDDGDSFMFGCTTLIKAQKVGGKRVNDHIRVYRADAIAEKLDFDADSLVMFALLAGGDYDTTGLRGCGPVNAARVCKRSLGLAQQIVNISPPGLPAWRHHLGQALREQIPPDFPTMKVLDGYRRPAVSTDEQCLNLSGLQGGWVKKIDESKLRVELRQRYSFTTREYLKHLGPVFLARALANATTPFWRQENLNYNVRLKSNRRKKDDHGNPVKCEVKVIFSAHELVDIDLTVQPSDEDWSSFAAKDGTPYDPQHQIECEMLECLLQRGLPEGSWDAPASQGKGKRRADEGEQSEDEGSGNDLPNTRMSDDRQPDKTAPRKRGRPPKDPSQKAQPAKKKRKSKQADPPSESPPPATFKHLDLPELRLRPQVVDLGDESDDDEDDFAVEPVVPQRPNSLALDKTTTIKRPPKFRPLSPRGKASTSSQTSALSAKPKRPPAKQRKSSQQQASDPHRPPTSKPTPPAPSKGVSPPRSTKRVVPPPPRTTPSVESEPSTRHVRPSSAATEQFIPGQTMDPMRLRELRLAALQNVGANNVAQEPPRPTTMPLEHPKKGAASSIVIDLT